MTKAGAHHSLEDYLSWLEDRMDFEPEDLIDLQSARTALARSLEGTTAYPGSAAQQYRVDWYVANVSRPAIQAGVSPHLAYDIATGQYDVRFSIQGLRGLFGWDRTSSIIEERTGITPAAPFVPGLGFWD